MAARHACVAALALGCTPARLRRRVLAVSRSIVSSSQRLLRSRGVQSAVAAVLLGALIVVFVHLLGGPQGIRTRFGLLAPAVWIPLQIVVHTTPVGDFLPWAILNGSMFGLWLGALATWLSWMGSASVQYAIGRRTARDFGFSLQTARLPAWLRRLPIDHPAFLIVARWFPLMAGPVNLTAGAARVPFGRVLWCTAIGIVPQALFLAAVGVGVIGAM
jgi:uncharacterized membrane protein YdjX (TVP38/TMEM64 family)